MLRCKVSPEFTFIEISTDLPEDVDSGGGRRRRVTAEYPSAAAIDAAEQTEMVNKDSSRKFS